MASTTGEKDARRRRLKERGTDRLALITGKIQTLPSPSPDPEYHHSHTSSCPPTIPDDFDQSSSDPSETNINPRLPPQGGDDSKGTFTRSRTEVHSREVVSEYDDKPHSLNSSSVSTPAPKQPTRHRIITGNQIVYGIAVSENIRIFISLLAAILVVLSNIKFPIISSYFVLRPIYMVFVTNMTIVAGRILLDKKSRAHVVERDLSGEGGPDGGSDLAHNVGMALESGFVLQNVLGAVFMDTSVYAVVIICGISLAQTLAW